jgi:glycosyltransferase involved in cell wall biosynthesis
MFKNESKVIRNMLESCYKYIDYWVVQDNGSTDGTPDIVKEFFADKGIPGFLYQVDEGWVSFGWNRDHLLQTCLKHDHGCDWILKMDCDETLEVDDDFDWSVFDDTSIQSFHVPAKAPGIIYYRAWIWNAKLPWRFNHDVAHETISLEMDGIGEDFQRVNLPMSFRQIGYGGGGESYSLPTKYVTDSLKLEEKMIRENTLLTDHYHFWYIGKSYSDATGCQTFPLGKSQQIEFARRSIYYFDEYVNHVHDYRNTNSPKHLDEFSYYAFYCIGNSYRFLGDTENAIDYFNRAGQFCPRRNEHLVRLCEICSETGDYATMLQMTTFLLSDERKCPFPDLMFLLDSNCYHDTGNYIQQLNDFALSKIHENQK